MAAIEKLNIPDKTIKANWKDDIDVGYATYGDSDKAEREYISPEKVSMESMKRIKQIKQRIVGYKALDVFKMTDKNVA